LTLNEHWIDKTLDELGSRGANCSASFTDELELRLMKERERNPVRRRRMVWTLGLALLTAGVAGGAFANTNAIKNWFYGPFHMGSDGVVRDANGAVVGKTRHLENGTKEVTLDLENASLIIEGGNLPVGSFSFTFEPSDESARDKSGTQNRETSDK
jgi:hypothetical protein